MKKATFSGLLVVLVLSVLSGCAKATTGTGSAEGFKGPVEVSVTVKDGKVTGATLTSMDDTQEIGGVAASQVIQQAVSTGKVEGLDVVSGATITSEAVIKALQSAYATAMGQAPTEVAAVAQDTSCDIVVIGAGGAGLSAATEAAGKGKSVIVLEKMGIVGGNTNYATGGLNASETSVQAGLGIADTNEAYIADTMKGGGNINDEELVRTMVEKSAETVDWLIEIGADLTDVGKMAGSSNNRTHRPQGGAAVGAHLSKVLDNAARAAGADIRLNSTVTSILNEGGKAVGVVVSGPNGNYSISAKAVIVATGGFGANPELVESLNTNLAGFGTTNHAGATGDAFDLVKPFDAAVVDMAQIQTHPTVVPVKNLMITEAVRGNGAIMVNREGKRFGSEMATRDVMSAAVLDQTGDTAYLLFDQGIRESLKAIEGYAKQGLLTEGATVAELAEKLSMPADVLEATVNTYNEYQAAGNDAEFGRKGSEMPRPIATGPFYAVEVGPAIHHTMGGLKINTNAEVLNNAGAVIPGLYAAGEVTGGIHGNNRLGGNAVADITVFGKIAGANAATYVDTN